MLRVPGWRGCPCWVLGESCLNSSGSSTCCKLLLYLIPPTVISSLSLLPNPGTCLHRGHRRRQLVVNLGSLSVHLTLLTPKQMFLEGSLQASPHSEAGEVIPETLARTGPAHSRRSHSVLTAVDQPTPGWLSGSEQPCTHHAPWRLGQEFKQGLMGMLCLYLGVSRALASGLHSWGYWHRRPRFAGRPGPMLVPGMAGY